MTSKSQSKLGINVGVDVGKAQLDVYLHEHQLHWQEDNTQEGIKRIVRAHIQSLF